MPKTADKFDQELEGRRAAAAAVLSRVADAYASWMEEILDRKPCRAVLKHLRAGRLTDISPFHWHSIRDGIKTFMDIEGDQGAKDMHVFAVLLTKYDTIGFIHDAMVAARLGQPQNRGRT